MKALKTAASFLIASTIIFQGIGLQTINVLADDSDTLSIAGGYAKQEDKNTTYFTLDATNNSVTYYNYSGAFEVEDQDFMSVTCTTTEKDPDIVAKKYVDGGTYVDINLSDCLYTFSINHIGDDMLTMTISTEIDGQTVYVGREFTDYGEWGIYVEKLVPNSIYPATCNFEYVDGNDHSKGFVITNNATVNDVLYTGVFTYDNSHFQYVDPSDAKLMDENLVAFKVYSYDVDEVNKVPVYKQVTEYSDIVDGNKYIIVAERGDNKYALYPNVSRANNPDMHFVRITDTYTTGITKLDFQVKDDENLVGGEKTTFIIGGTEYPFELQVKKYSTNMLSNVADIKLLKGESKTVFFPGFISLGATSSNPIVDLNEISFNYVYDAYIADNSEKGNSGFISVADCLYKFELQSNGNYVISSVANEGLYLTTDSCFSNKTVSTEFSVQHVDGSRKFVLVNAADSNKSFYLGSDAVFNGNGTDSTNEVYLYQKASGKGSLEVPGYDRVTSIVPNGEYLIVLINKAPSEAKYYVVNPSIESNSKASFVERESSCYTKLDITATEEGTTKITAGSYSFNVTVNDAGEIVTYENTPFSELNDTYFGQRGLPITKLHIYEGAMYYPVFFDKDRVGNATDFHWSTVNPDSPITINVDGQAMTTISIDSHCTSDTVLQEFLSLEYTCGDVTHIALLPVMIYPSSYDPANPNTFKYHVVDADENVKAYYSINGLKLSGEEYLVEAKPGETFMLSNSDGKFAFNMFYAPVGADCNVTDFNVYGLGSSTGTPTPIDILMLDATTSKDTSFYNSEIGQIQATNYGGTFDAVLNEAMKKGCTAGYAYNEPSGKKLTFVAKATEAELVPLTDLSVSLAKDIKLSDGTTATAGKKVNLYKVYYVNSSESTLAAFSGTKSISSVKAVYDLSTGSDVTSSFVKSGNDMLFTSAGAGQKDYVVEYTLENGTSKLYAVRVITLEDMFVGTSLSIGGKISLNFYATYATQTTASNSANGTYPVAGVDYSNLPSDIQPTVRFKVGDKVVSEGVTSTKTVGSASGAKYYGFTFEGIYAYDIGKMITAELIYDNKVIASCEYSVGDYMEAVFNSSSDTKLNDMLAALAAYGCSAEKYALDKGWVDVLTLENKHYDYLIPDSISTTNAIVDNGTGIADFYGASVVLSEGATVSLKFRFTVDTDDISSVNLIIDNASCITADGKSTVTVNGADFTYAGTMDGKKLYTVSIDNIAPYNWNNSFTVYLDKDGSSKGLTYSVDNYFVAAQDDETVGELVKLMFAYGEATRVWAGK